MVGSCAGAGVPNGVGVEAPLSIYVKRAIESAKKRDTAEISVGYTSIDIDKHGWGCNETGEYIFEEFKADSLATYAGKPITLGHVTVTPENADRVVVGSCAGAGVPNGVGVEAPLSIYVKRAIESAKKRDTAEISVGYTSIDIDKHGWGCNETGEYIFEEDMKADEQPPKGWVKFDALQTNISVNHIALVFKGRAGIAKLNLDSEQEFPYDNSVKSDDGDITMTVKIKLDGAVEFDVPKEVATFIDNLKADVTAANKKLMALKQSATTSEKSDAYIEAAFDMAQDLDITAENRATIKGDAEKQKKKMALIRILILTHVSEKSDAYIEAAFDMAQDLDITAENRATIKGDAEKQKKKMALIRILILTHV
ncbi:head maturation protease [Citrobacter phage HCF1]|uniref:Capsid and scaffold protein n=1 Tax=Citrobacter phage HCF1 TaxID=2849700 RepID=A0ABX6D664_9CAUD|nr:head maturation protease [Citrobacter phage HCF1]